MCKRVLVCQSVGVCVSYVHSVFVCVSMSVPEGVNHNVFICLSCDSVEQVLTTISHEKTYYKNYHLLNGNISIKQRDFCNTFGRVRSVAIL